MVLGYMTARNHHFVPQCYLRGFTTAEQRTSRLFVVDAVKRQAFETVARNVGAERDFNRIDSDTVAPDALENGFATFEGELATSLKRIRETMSLSNGDDRANLLNFICALILRNPRQRQRIGAFETTVLKRVLSLALSTRKTWNAQVRNARAAGFMEGLRDLDYEEMKRHHENGAFEIVIPRMRHIASELALFNDILPLFFERKWSLLKAPATSSGFITSDHPVCLMWADPKKRGGFYSPGLGLRGTELLFPISKELFVAGVFEGQETVRHLTSEHHVAGLNGAIVTYAERQVYGQNDRFTYSMQITEPPQQARQLLSDPRFKRPRPAETFN